MIRDEQAHEADQGDAEIGTGSVVHNIVATDSSPGVVVQAGTITGGIHHHLSPHQLPTPRQLPPEPRHFIGRAAELAQLSEQLKTSDEDGGTVVISALAGAGGIGKTTLAVHWAHANSHYFPDGCLFVNLQGFSPADAPMEPAAAVRGFLDAFGVDPHRIPADLQAQTALYRSLVAGKRMLILLDNAASVSQVAPLLPGSPTCTVVVTSRHRLAGLTTVYGARLLDLDVLPTADARALLARLSRDWLEAGPETIAELLAICAGLPLAVRIVAARAELHPDFPLTFLTEELRDTAARLDGLDTGGPHANLRAVLSWSTNALSASAASLFGLLGVAPGPDISLPAVESLAGRSKREVLATLRELESASLVQQHAPNRYRMHDLIRLHAKETSQYLDDDVRNAALRRVLDHYSHTAQIGDRLLNPYRPAVMPEAHVSEVLNPSLPDTGAVMAWFEAEYSNLLAAQLVAGARHEGPIVWRLAWNLRTYQLRRGHLNDRVRMWRAASNASHRLGTGARIHTHRQLGDAYTGLGCHDDALEHLHEALILAEHHDVRTDLAHCHRTLALVWERCGDDQQALHHATQALHIFRSCKQPAWEANALNIVGWYEARLGAFDTARCHCQAALILHQRHDDDVAEAATLDVLGYIDRRTGYHHRAIGSYQRALALHICHGNTVQVATTLDALGHAHTALGHGNQARTAWHQALQLYEEQGRENDAARIQRQLKELDQRDDT